MSAACTISLCISAREGAVVSSGKGMKQISRATHSQVSDVTGAGDAAVAGLVYGLSQGYDLSKSAQSGQAAASLVLSSTASTAVGLTEMALQQHIQGLHYEISTLSISNDVRNGARGRQAVVALESTIIAHGMPYPAQCRNGARSGRHHP